MQIELSWVELRWLIIQHEEQQLFSVDDSWSQTTVVICCTTRYHGAAESQTESLTWECCRQQLIAAVAWWVSVSSVQRVPSRAVYFFYIGINYPRLLLCENGPSSCDGTILPSTTIIIIITRHLLHPLTSINQAWWVRSLLSALITVRAWQLWVKRAAPFCGWESHHVNNNCNETVNNEESSFYADYWLWMAV